MVIEYNNIIITKAARIVSLTAVIIFFAVTLHSQQRHVKGFVQNTLLKPVEGATVEMLKISAPARAVKTISDTGGEFHITLQDTGTFILTVTCTGYKDTLILFSDKDEMLLSMPPIVLQQQIHELKPVEVVAAQRAITVNNGKFVFNVAQSPVAAGNSVFELLQKMPGIAVDANENLLLKGSAAGAVMIDGKLTFLSGTQLSNMLKSMGSDNISRIEMINSPSAQYDAAGNNGLINIITKKNNKQGYAADITAGITVGRYLLNTESINGNIKTKRINFFGSAGYNFRHSDRIQTSQQYITQNNQSVLLDRAGNDPHKSYYYDYKAGIDFTIDAKQQAGFSYTGYIDDWSKDAAGTTLLREGNGTPMSKLISRNFAKEPYYNNVFNLNYKYSIDTLGSVITADADHISYLNNSDGFVSSTEYDLNNMPLQAYQQLNFHQPSNISVWSFKTDFDYFIHKYRFKAGVKYSAVTIDNNFRYDSLINGDYHYAPSLSDNFLYKEKIVAGYTSAEKQWKNISVNGGLRMEHTFADGNAINTGIENIRRYTTLFPSVTFTHTLKKGNHIDFSVSRRINRPSYSSLNPVRYFSDKYAYYSGNPDLVAEKSWIVAATLTAGNYIFTLQHRRINDFISQSAHIDSSSGILITGAANFSHNSRTDAQVIAPFKIAAFWEINTFFILTYTSYPIQQISGFNNISRFSAHISASQSFVLPGNIRLEFTVRYTTPELYGIYLSRYDFSFDGGCKKSLFHKKIDARLSFTDLFHTQRGWGSSLSHDARYSYVTIPYSRRVSLSFSYHIGGNLIKNKLHQIEEQQRL